MKYVVKVKPGSSQEKVVKNTDGGLTVFLHARAHDGEANKALIEVLAKNFKVPKTSIEIVQGAHSREKVIEL